MQIDTDILVDHLSSQLATVTTDYQALLQRLRAGQCFCSDCGVLELPEALSEPLYCDVCLLK